MSPVTSTPFAAPSDDNGSLLDIVVRAVPSPLQASPVGGDPSLGEIDVLVSNNGTNAVVNCTSISIAVPCMTKDPGHDTPNESYNLTDNPGSVIPPDPTGIGVAWKFMGSVAANGQATFEFKPALGGANAAITTTASLYFRLPSIEVNEQPGTCTITVVDTSSVSPSPSADPAPPGRSQFSVPKFPAGFFFGGFTANHAEVPYNQPVLSLSWTGSEGAAYYLYCGDDGPIDVTNVRTYPPTGGLALTQDTTFLLEAVVDGVMTAEESVTVTVDHPDVSANNLGVAGLVGMMNPSKMVAVKEGTYEPSPTDALVLGNVLVGAWPQAGGCAGIIAGQCGDLVVTATAATTLTVNSGNQYYLIGEGNSFVLPVPAGQSWTIASSTFGNPGITTSFFWLPFGAADPPTPSSLGSPTDDTWYKPFPATPVKVINGAVHDDGTIAAGSGFHVSKANTGTYVITFDDDTWAASGPVTMSITPYQWNVERDVNQFVSVVAAATPDGRGGETWTVMMSVMLGAIWGPVDQAFLFEAIQVPSEPG